MDAERENGRADAGRGEPWAEALVGETARLALLHKGVSDGLTFLNAQDMYRREASACRLPVGSEAAAAMALQAVETFLPEPPLYPHDEQRRAEVELFVEWFELVWARAAVDVARVGHRKRARAFFSSSLDRFEVLLDGRPYLFGDIFGAADCVAFPLLRHALGQPRRGDAFATDIARHLVLERAHAGLRLWIGRVSRYLAARSSVGALTSDPRDESPRLSPTCVGSTRRRARQHARRRI